MALTIKRDELQAFADLLQRKQALDAELSSLKVAINQFQDRVLEQMVASGRTTANRYGWNFAVTRGNASVAWKQEFIRLAGEEAAIALSVAAQGNGRDTLNISPPMEKGTSNE